jgi:D-aminopeptidase
MICTTSTHLQASKKKQRSIRLCILVLMLAMAAPALAGKPRARDLGIPFDGTPGQYNAITDVAGVTVGFSTVITDLPNNIAVRTGVTAILPRGRSTLNQPVFAGVFSLNGNGEMTGSHWVEESGFLEGPVMLTNTHSVGVVRDAVIRYRVQQGAPDPSGYWWSLPVVAETWDGDLNDINGFHITAEHAVHAIDSASSGPVLEGNVGGGAGMICHEFKCGTGTASRIATIDGHRYTVGALVQANYGVRSELRIAGVPVGQFLKDDLPSSEHKDSGSIIIVLATDAPLLPTQLQRLARRAAMGLARNGSYAGNGSGDIFIAFSTANPGTGQHQATDHISMLGNDELDPLFIASIDSTEEAIVNSMIAADTMTGTGGFRAVAIDHNALRKVLKRYGRLLPGK